MTACVLLSCGERSKPSGGSESTAPAVSEALLREFPLLPMAEPQRWSRLLEAEAERPATEESRERVESLAEELRRLHPFSTDDEGMELGGIRFDAESATFRRPARVRYPDEGDERHPGELELLLCSGQGRVHETLFECDLRPLHLELLLHLAGYRKESEPATFGIRVVAPLGESIPVRELVRRMDAREWSGRLEWEFSGSKFGDLYAPDLSGDFAIFWHAHDSVLRVRDEAIGTGELKLRAIRHPALPNGSEVVLEMKATGRSQ